MKNLIIFFMLLFPVLSLQAQVSGNVNYQGPQRYPDKYIDVGIPGSFDFYISIKGLANVKADLYVAIFSVSQTGKTTEEANRLIDERINQAVESFKSKPGIEVYVDMISFVPMYEYESEKKLFSKKTYNEIPAGFELKKNIHIRYANSDMLNQIISLFAAAEIYDLVRVDYISEKIETVKAELMNRAKTLLQEKYKSYQSIMGFRPDTLEKKLADGYRIFFPVEMYRSYQAYNSSLLNLKKGNVNYADKSTTLYYQPITSKEFDFVINPVIVEPVIQVLYELKVGLNLDPQQSRKPRTNYIYITPNGELKNLHVK
jgi:uncharacterized protein YggE